MDSTANENQDMFCPECQGEVNEYGFCVDCGYDVEEFIKETEDDWNDLKP